MNRMYNRPAFWEISGRHSRTYPDVPFSAQDCPLYRQVLSGRLIAYPI